jgi:hypothetical protein
MWRSYDEIEEKQWGPELEGMTLTACGKTLFPRSAHAFLSGMARVHGCKIAFFNGLLGREGGEYG